LWAAWQGNRLQASLNAAVGLLGVGISLATVWAMQRAIDIAAGVSEGSVLWAVGILALLILCEFAVGISRVWIRNILGVKAQNRMQQQMLARLLRSEWRGREAMHSGDVINRLEEDVKTVVNFLTETLPSTLATMAMFVGAFVYLFSMDTWLALITVGILPLFILLSRFYIEKMRRLSRSVRESDSRVQSILTETMQHRMLVKTMEADEQMLSRLEATQQQLRQRVKRRTVFSVTSNLILNSGFSLGYLIAFLWGLIRMQAGTISFGALAAFLQLVNRIQGPARDLTRLAPAFVSVFTAAERLMELEQVPEEEQGEPIMMPAPCGIRFRDVTYNYGAEGQQPIISHANYDFPPGSCTAIMGETGSGKTTLIRLLLALVHPQEGTISIYSAVRNDKTQKEEENVLSPLHRCNFVYVPQGNTLLSGTLRENMLLGRSDATDDEMMAALRTACADFVDSLSNGLDTVFAEQGGGLSEGQAQRIAIARALLRPGSIMLFDEATSALDPDTERLLLKNILRHRQKTVIFVTHRPAVIDYCDHVIRTDEVRGS
jgi:ABC-type multidrug transport system fused ATPase/permease subunit